VNSILGFRSLILFSALVFGFAAAETQTQTGSFERSYAIDGPLKLDIETDSGSIKIRGGPPGHAEITGHARPARRFLNR
jgi:hypothetical protein